ncbi:MAG TPA: hydroxymethylpyrimidine/phosphomethylpyrimidine kinase [Vulgatibacter sp.]
MLVLAGLDPSGSAGLFADGLAIRAAGGRPLLCSTALTVQSTKKVRSFEAVDPAHVEAQVLALLEDEAEIGAVKLGMLGSRAVAATIADLRRHSALASVPWVIDPVLFSSSGAPLVEGGAAAYEGLLRGAIVTPNAPEAAALAGTEVPRREEELLRCARAILGEGARAVIAKGGHLDDEPTDWVVTEEGATRLAGVRRAGSKRGTGCRFASYLATWLAAGDSLQVAAAGAKAYVAAYLDGAA